MNTWIYHWLENAGITTGAYYIAYAVLIVVLVVLCIVSHYIARKIVTRLLFRAIKSNRFQSGRIMLENKVFQRLTHIVPAVIMKAFASSLKPLILTVANKADGIYAPFVTILSKTAGIYLIVVGMMVLDSLLDSADAIYRTREVSKIRPIKGYLQVVKIVIYILGGIIIVANLINENPLVFLSGIGAMTAVFSLVFKDSILGLVAGIQLSANDMVRIGDWIEMSKYGADGDVIDISLNTVKVQNFDNSITTIPAYSLISDSFKNWRGMQVSGGRRIMRSINFDINSIQFCSDELLAKLKKSVYLKDYIQKKQAEFKKSNGSHPIDSDEVSSGKLTNIGVFRVYIQNYLNGRPDIHQKMTRVVRLLPPTEHGLPLQIYAFTIQTEWVEFEKIQSDIFDHIISISEQFELRIFQSPSGSDFRRLP